MHTKEIRLFFLIVCFACLFLCSCGLDEYYVIDPPTSVHSVSIETSDPAEMYYSFTCPAVSVVASSQINTLGTAVYYKVYNDADKAESERKAIDTANTEYSESGYNKMISFVNEEEGESSKYRQMSFIPKIGNGNSSEYITMSATASSWYMKLSPDDDIDGYKALSLTKYLNQSSNEDCVIYINNPDGSGTFYINAYAVVVGIDSSLKTQRSQLAPLGILKFEL